MALSASTIHEVETVGSDTLNGGMFDPSQTAGMFTDGAATLANSNAPSFTSVSYTFLAADIGAWVYVALGTNWTLGWYKITNVISGAAILNGTIGQGVLKTTLVPSTLIGCAAAGTGSPTGATWTIDYSQQAAAQFTYLDLASAGTGLTVSSAAKPFAKQQVGNCIVVTGGTNLNTGRYVIASVAAVTFIATVVGPTNITTGAGLNGIGGMGGAWLSAGASWGVAVTNNWMHIKSGTYSITTTSTNVAGGCLISNTRIVVEGYGAVRGDYGTAPILQASGISTCTLVSDNGQTQNTFRNITVDGALLTAIKGFFSNATLFYKCTAINCTNNGFGGSGGTGYFCKVTGCTTQTAMASPQNLFFCEAYNNSITGFGGAGNFINCLSYNNSGSTSDGFAGGSSTMAYIGCIAYGNGRHGISNANNAIQVINCIVEGHTAVGAVGINLTGGYQFVVNSAVYNNTTNIAALTISGQQLGTIILTASPFTNAASGDFSLNTAAGGGALLRAAGFPATFPAGTTRSYPDIGASQHANPVSMLYMPALTGGIDG